MYSINGLQIHEPMMKSVLNWIILTGICLCVNYQEELLLKRKISVIFVLIELMESAKRLGVLVIGRLAFFFIKALKEISSCLDAKIWQSAWEYFLCHKPERSCLGYKGALWVVDLPFLPGVTTTFTASIVMWSRVKC